MVVGVAEDNRRSLAAGIDRFVEGIDPVEDIVLK